MAEIQMFQPGTAFMNSYNQAKAGSLAKIAFTEPQRRQSALADLYGLDPQAANSMKKEFDAQEQEQLKTFATAFLNTTDDNLRTQMYGRAKEMWRPRFQALGSDIPDDWRQALPTIQAIAGVGQQQPPAKVQEAQWFAKQIGLDPAKDPQGYAEFMRQAAGYGGKGPKMSVAPDGTPYDAENFRVFRDGKWLDISPGALGGQTPPTQTGEYIGTPTTVQTDNEAPVDFSTLPADEQRALTLASQAAAQGKPFHYTVKGGVVAPAAPTVGSPVAPPSAIGQGRPLFAKPGSRPATPEEKAVYGIPPDVPAQIGPDGQVNVINLPKKDAPAGYRYAANGALEFIPGGPADPANKTNAKDSTADEKSAKGYLDRMIAAEKELDGLINSGFKPNVRDFYTAGQGAAINWAASPDGQVWRQQQEDWVRAKLRRESGAAIPPEEMDREIKTYFPQPGDSKQVIESKRRSRIMAQQQLKTMAGRANSSAAQPPAGGQGKSNYSSLWGD